MSLLNIFITRIFIVFRKLVDDIEKLTQKNKTLRAALGKDINHSGADEMSHLLCPCLLYQS